MIPFHLIFASVFAITILSGLAATIIALWGGNRSSQSTAEKLAQITILGAGALIALLGTRQLEVAELKAEPTVHHVVQREEEEAVPPKEMDFVPANVPLRIGTYVPDFVR